MQVKSKFKVGDKVRVKNMSYTRKEQEKRYNGPNCPGYAHDMDKFQGQVGIIDFDATENWNSYAIQFNEDDISSIWYFLVEDIELVEPIEQEKMQTRFKIGDRVIYNEEDEESDSGKITDYTEEFGRWVWWVKWDSDGKVQWADEENLTLESIAEVFTEVEQADFYKINKEDAEALLTALQKQDTVLYLLLKKSLFN